MDGCLISRMSGSQNRVIDQVSFHCTLPRIPERTNDRTVPIYIEYSPLRPQDHKTADLFLNHYVSILYYRRRGMDDINTLE